MPSIRTILFTRLNPSSNPALPSSNRSISDELPLAGFLGRVGVFNRVRRHVKAAEIPVEKGTAEAEQHSDGEISYLLGVGDTVGRDLEGLKNIPTQDSCKPGLRCTPATLMTILADPILALRLCEVIQEESGRRALTRLVRTSKALSKPATSLIWRKLDDMSPLLDLIPPATPTHSSQYIERLRWYGKFVHVLSSQPWDRGDEVSSSRMQALYQANNAEPLLPNLMSVTWTEFPRRAGERWISLIAKPMLHTLDLHLRISNGEHFDEIVAEILLQAVALKQLVSFSLRLVVDSPVVSSQDPITALRLSQVLPAHITWRHVVVRIRSSSNQTVDSLTLRLLSWMPVLPNLSSLALNIRGINSSVFDSSMLEFVPGSSRGDVVTSASIRFAGLRALFLEEHAWWWSSDDLLSFFSSLRCPLQELKLHCLANYSHSGEIISICDVLSTRFGDTLTKLSLDLPGVKDNPIEVGAPWLKDSSTKISLELYDGTGSMHDLHFQTLRQLHGLHFQTLRQLHIHRSSLLLVASLLPYITSPLDELQVEHSGDEGGGEALYSWWRLFCQTLVGSCFRVTLSTLSVRIGTMSAPRYQSWECTELTCLPSLRHLSLALRGGLVIQDSDIVDISSCPSLQTLHLEPVARPVLSESDIYRLDWEYSRSFSYTKIEPEEYPIYKAGRQNLDPSVSATVAILKMDY